MRIQLTNVKIARNLSEETTAFTGFIRIDGIPTFHVSNHGHGGCNQYDRMSSAPPSQPSLEEVAAWVQDHEPPVRFDAERYGRRDPIPCDLDMFCSRELERVETKKFLDRHLKTKIVVYDEKKGLRTFKLKGGPIDDLGIQWFKTKYPEMAPDVINGQPETSDLYTKALVKLMDISGEF